MKIFKFTRLHYGCFPELSWVYCGTIDKTKPFVFFVVPFLKTRSDITGKDTIIKDQEARWRVGLVGLEPVKSTVPLSWIKGENNEF